MGLEREPIPIAAGIELADAFTRQRDGLGVRRIVVRFLLGHDGGCRQANENGIRRTGRRIEMEFDPIDSGLHRLEQRSGRDLLGCRVGGKRDRDFQHFQRFAIDREDAGRLAAGQVPAKQRGSELSEPAMPAGGKTKSMCGAMPIDRR